MSIEYGPGLTLPPNCISIGRMFGQRHMGSSFRCSREWWNWRWGRMRARSRFPNPLDHHHPQWVQMFPNRFCSAPSWEVSQQFVTFRHLPSLLPSSEQAWQMFQGSWIRDEQSKQGMSLSTVSIREWGRERGRKEESLTADSAILWLKVSLIGFPHSVESRQVT